MKKNIFILALLLALPAWAQPKAENLTKAAETAKTSQQDIIILAYGPDWDPVSTQFKEKIWNSPELEAITKDAIITELPCYQNPNEEQRKERDEAGKILQAGPNTLPAIFIADETGRSLVMVSGSEILKSSKDVAKLVKEKLDARAKQKELIKSAEAATGVDKAKLLGQACELGLAHPKDAIKLIKEADPSDTSNYAKRLELNTWAIIGEVNKLEDLNAAKELAKTYTDNEAYTPLQRQEIWVAIIGRMRREDINNRTALREACLAMKKLDPKSLYGTVADAVIEKCCQAPAAEKK